MARTPPAPDLALDLGTSRVRIAPKGGPVALDVPTVAALRGREAVAVGEEAARLAGRSPAGVEVVRPVRAGVVADFHAAEQLLARLLAQVGGRGIRRPRVLVALQGEPTEVERRAIQECVRAAGARDVVLVDGLIAAAVGAGLAVLEPVGHMIADLGAGGSRAGITSLGGLAVRQGTAAGGDAIDEAIRAGLRDARSLQIEERTAAHLKQHLLDASGQTTRQIRIRGRDLLRMEPREEAVSSPDLSPAAAEPIHRIRDAIRDVLRRASPELSADLLDHGLFLCGGGAALRGLDAVLREDTGLPVLHAETPEHCVVRGATWLLDDPALLDQLVAAR